ncbi:MAG: hypothetical protein D6717_05270, partial [Gammaproteobacteria bacterium]
MHSPATDGRLCLQGPNLSLEAVELEHHETVGRPFVARVVIPHLDPRLDLIGRSLQLVYPAPDGTESVIAGVIAAARVDHAGRGELLLCSHAVLLDHTRHHRLWLDRDFAGLARALFEEAGFPRGQLQFDLRRSHPVRPWRLQADENDLEFLQRLC